MANKERKESSPQGAPEELFRGPEKRDLIVADDLSQKSPLRIVESVTTSSVSEEPKRYE